MIALALLIGSGLGGCVGYAMPEHDGRWLAAAIGAIAGAMLCAGVAHLAGA